MKVFGVICVNNCGNVLLVRGRKSRKWSFPKGHCKQDENDLECALRELREETGLDITNQKYSSYHKLRGGGYFLFAIEGNPTLKIGDSWEVEEVAWWPLSRLPHLDSNVDVSIFRTLMKSNYLDLDDQDDLVKFIDSPEARKKVSIIKNNINPRNGNETPQKI